MKIVMCRFCHARFRAENRKNVYCSPRCHSAAYRNRHPDRAKKQARDYYWRNRTVLLEKNRIYTATYRKTVRYKQLKHEWDRIYRLRHIESLRRKNRQCYYKHRESVRLEAWTLKLQVLAKLGGRCFRCGIDDPRVLHVNHIKGDGYVDRHRFGYSHAFYKAIIRGARAIFDLNILCANCNQIYEFERGRYILPTIVQKGTP